MAWRGFRAAVAAAVIVAFGGAVASATEDTPESLRAEAFEAAQWAIASDAADALAKVSARFAQGDDAIGTLADEREGLIARRDTLEREVEALYSVEGEEGQRRRAESRAAYQATIERLSAVDAEINSRFPAYADLTAPKALSVEEVQGLLKDDEGLLLVLVNPEASYVWAVSRDRVEWARSEDLNERGMDDVVARLREPLTTTASRSNPYINPARFAGRPAPVFDRKEAYRLYSELIKPVEGVFEGKSTLITVTTGSLATLPLATLVTEEPTSEDNSNAALASTDWLIDRYALATMPAVSSLKALRCYLVPASDRSNACPEGGSSAGETRVQSRNGGGVQLVAFGAPVLAGDVEETSRGAPPAGQIIGKGKLADVDKLRALPSLPGSKDELTALKARYPRSLVRMGAEATETAVRQSDAATLAQARFVVFSTHGLMAGADQAEPGLVMTPPAVASEADDGYLTASEAAQLRLTADFVVLSACNTAASDGRPGGEGLSGLARAFFYAGARSVVVSHWEVSDAATTELMGRTFAAIDDRDIGGRARALKAGMEAVRRNPRWVHPAYWAPFTLVGEPG